MFYSVTKSSKGVVYVDNVYVISRTVVLRDMQKYMVHVDNVYVISRTVALRDMQIYILEWYIVIFMCSNFTITISIYIQLTLFVQSPCNFT